MSDKSLATYVEGVVSGTQVDFEGQTTTASIFNSELKIIVPSIIRLDPGAQIRAIGFRNDGGDLMAVDIITSPNERPITDKERNEQFRRLGVAPVYEAPKTVSFDSVIGRLTDVEVKLIQYLSQNPKLMREMHPDAFEKLIAEMLAAQGFRVDWTGRNKNTSGDVLALRTDPALGLEENYIVECKRYAEENKVGLSIALALYGAKCRENFSNALLVTTSTFESGVNSFAMERWDFQTKDFTGLVQWLNNYRPRHDGRLHMVENRLVIDR